MGTGELVEMSDAQLLEAHRWMLLSRTLDERAFKLQRQGRLGTYAPCIGQEATIVGTSLALRPGVDWIVPQYRETAALLRHGWPLRDAFLYFLGHPHGHAIPADSTRLPIQIALAAQIPQAMGLAWGLKRQGSDAVVFTYFGEGAASEGDFHEALNFAGALKVPCVFVLQDNGWAISTPRSQQSAAADLSTRGEGYGVAGELVDGNDLLAVHAAALAAVERARAGEGPTLIVAQTYRLWAHNTIDDPTRYVDPEELKEAEKRDPLPKVRALLSERKLLPEEEEAELRRELAEEIDAAFVAAEAYPPPAPGELFEHLQATVSPRLAAQRDEILALEAEGQAS